MSGRPGSGEPARRYASRRFARRFDRLRRFQIAPVSLASRIEEICALHGARVVELGAGTGVLTEELACRAEWVFALDYTRRMLELGRDNLRQRGLSHVRLALAEHRALPLPSGCADLVLAAWALDSLVYGSEETSWRLAVDQAVKEMSRVAARGGVVLIIASPHGARDLGGHLERVHRFQRRFFKAVWRFPSRRVARAATRLFFGRAAWEGYRPNWPKDLVTLAGIWWRRVSTSA